MSDERVRVDEPRADGGRAWEVFARDDAADPLCHVGSVDAPSSAVARERAEKLFGWTVETLWLCPADETRRYAPTDRTLDGAATATDCGDASTGAGAEDTAGVNGQP